MQNDTRVSYNNNINYLKYITNLTIQNIMFYIKKTPSHKSEYYTDDASQYKECKDLNIDQRAIDEWFNRYRTFINFKDYDQEMTYEDFVPTDSSVNSTIKYNIDYESRINNISHVKEEYKRCMKLLN